RNDAKKNKLLSAQVDQNLQYTQFFRKDPMIQPFMISSFASLRLCARRNLPFLPQKKKPVPKTEPAFEISI
ncbi:MAG: hypothetical protein ACK5VX_20550, partial [Akkermansiaceae bacterium]